MRARIEAALSALLAVAAVAVGVALVHREFFSGHGATSTDGKAERPVYLAEWTSILRSGVLVGNAAARVKIIEFGDIECPFCARFDATVREVRKTYNKDVAFVFVHFPLPMHRFARPAARAVECASKAGSFDELLGLLYRKQDSLGLKSWASFAREAGIRDTSAFARCSSDTATIPRIEAGFAYAQKLALRGTPTVLVNGWRFPRAPDQAELSRTIAALLAGRQPFSDLIAPSRP